jgi:hypothetical protein
VTATTTTTTTGLVSPLVARIGLIILAIQGLGTGLWATIDPRGFYDDFPGLGMSWVAPDGPFNEHLMRDYGALNLALGVLAVCAAVWLTRALVAAAAIAWIVYSIPHIAYHAFNGQHYDSADHVAIVASLAFTPIIAIVVLWSARGASARGASTRGASGRAESPTT